MYQQVKFEVINPDSGENVFGGIAIVNDRDKTITNVICGCCGSVFGPEDIRILERYNNWVDLTETIIGD